MGGGCDKMMWEEDDKPNKSKRKDIKSFSNEEIETELNRRIKLKIQEEINELENKIKHLKEHL